MTTKKLVLSTETLRLLSERDAEGVYGGSVSVSVTPSQHTKFEANGCAIKFNGGHLVTSACQR